MTTFVGISAPIGAGKSLFASLLAEQLGDRASVIHTADALKEICAQVFGRPLNEFHDRDLKEEKYGMGPIVIKRDHIEDICHLANLSPTNPQITKHIGVELHSPRHVAQYVGTDVMRAIEPDVHVANLLRLGSQKQPNGIVLVPDVRFVNEQEAMDISLYIYRPEIESKLNLKNLHESEQALPKLKRDALIILNEASLIELEGRAVRLADSLMRDAL